MRIDLRRCQCLGMHLVFALQYGNIRFAIDVLSQQPSEESTEKKGRTDSFDQSAAAG